MISENIKRIFSSLVFILSFILLADAFVYAEEKVTGTIRFSSPDEVQVASSIIGLRRCKTSMDYMISNGWCYYMTDKIAYTTDFFVGYGIFISDPQNGERYTWRYYYPNGELYTEQYWEFYIDPVEGCCWKSSLGHLACGGCAAFLMMGFFLQNNPFIKPGLWTVKVYRDVSSFGTDSFTIKCGERLVILSPEQGDDFNLTNNNYIATPDIPFMAVIDPSNISEKINWTLALEYSTSGGHCGCSDQRSFSSDPNELHNEGYESMGGQLTINASAQVHECEAKAEPIIITITGVRIPDNLITERLLQLYHGPTERLMIGLAREESSYMQFSERILYNRVGLWPRESEEDGGSHIGLMQVETTMERAWDWMENTRYGVDFFRHDKIGIARFWQRQIRQEARDLHGCHLRPLDSVELENMALVLYGDHALNAVDGQYYYYQVTPEGNCEWIVNTQGNREGVAYANAVRDSSMR